MLLLLLNPALWVQDGDAPPPPNLAGGVFAASVWDRNFDDLWG